MVSAARSDGFCDAAGIAADFLMASARVTPSPDLVHIGGFHVAGHHAAAIQSQVECHTFFGRPHDHLQRVPRAKICQRSQCLDDTQRGQRSRGRRRSCRHSERNRCASRRGSAARRSRNPRDVRRYSRPGQHVVQDRLHASTRSRHRNGSVGVRVSDAAHSVGERPAGRSAEHAECFDALPQIVASTQRHVCAGRGRGGEE